MGILNHLRRRRFLSDRKGSVAVEFAFVGLLLITILLSMVETGALLIRISTLEFAVSNISQKIYTGQTTTRSAVQQEICDTVSLFPNCLENINVELTQISTFGLSPSNDVECQDEGDEDFSPATTYQTGTASQINFLRICITTDLLTPGLGLGFSLPQTDNGRFQVVSSTAFANEPF